MDKLELTDELREVALDALEYFEQRQDTIDGDYGIPEPNNEMVMASRLRDALERAGVKV